MADKKPYILSAVSGLAMFFVYPNFLGVEIWPLAFVVLAPMIMALDRARSTRNAALIAAAGGLAGYPLLYHWLVYTMHTYGGMSYPVSVFVLLAMVLVLTLFLSLFGASYHLLTRSVGLSPLISAPLAWTAIEFLRAHFPFGGFPWALLGYSQHRFLALIQIAEWTGPYGISFLVMLVNASVAKTIEEITTTSSPDATGRTRLFRIVAPTALAAFLVAATALFGLVRMGMVDRAFENRPQIKVGVVQGNVDQAVKWSPEFFWKTLHDHLNLTDKLLRGKSRLIIWPEASVTVSGFNEHWEKRSPVIDMLSRIDAYFLVGSLSRESCGDQRCIFNSVYLLSPRAERMLARYDKIRLVPFSEYVPLQKLFFFADAIAGGMTGSTTPGSEVKVMSIPEGMFGCVICYEVIFPHLVRKFADKGASFMTTITNDAWFGKTGAPYQHHSAVVFRSVENRVYFVRSANTGISSIVDPNGRVVTATGLYVPAAFTGTIKTSPFRTFYTRYGDVFTWLTLACVLLALGYAAINQRRRGRGAPPPV